MAGKGDLEIGFETPQVRARKTHHVPEQGSWGHAHANSGGGEYVTQSRTASQPKPRYLLDRAEDVLGAMETLYLYMRIKIYD